MDWAEAEAPILWPPDVKSQLIGKDLHAGKDWGQEENGVTEGEMIWWHHRFSGHEFAQTLGDNEGWRSLVCCSPWGCKESDMTERLNHNSISSCWQSFSSTISHLLSLLQSVALLAYWPDATLYMPVQIWYCTSVLFKVLYCMIKSILFFVFMYYFCEKYYKPITVEYHRVDCVSWVLRLTFLGLGTNWT